MEKTNFESTNLEKLCKDILMQSQNIRIWPRLVYRHEQKYLLS